MSTRYPGGFISRSAPVIVGPVDGEGGSATGVWTLEQASYYTKQGTWPQRVKDRLVFAFGQNFYGEFGTGNTSGITSPVQVLTNYNWSDISIQSGASGFVNTLGQLWMAGDGTDGRLAQNSQISRSSPVQVGALTNWSKISVGGGRTTAGLKTDGTLWTWGYNSFGSMGDGTRVAKSSPVQVGSGYATISSGDNFFMAIKTNGTLWTTGANSVGQLGLSVTTNRSNPTQVGSLTNWAIVSCYSASTQAIKTDGTMWSWGDAAYGQLGLNLSPTTYYRNSPTQIGALTTWVKTSHGGRFGYAIKNDGTLWSWGYNSNGELGQNDRTSRSSPVQVGTQNNWANVFCGMEFMLAIKTDGTLWGCGNGYWGNLTGFNVIRSSPVQIGALTNWSMAACGTDDSLAVLKV